MPKVPSVSNLEKKAFVLFRDDCAEDFKRFVIYLVFKSIENNEGISRSRLEQILLTEYSLDSEVVNAALGALTSSEIFDSVSAYQVQKLKKQPIMLRLKRDLNKLNAWLDTIRIKSPTVLEFEAVKV